MPIIYISSSHTKTFSIFFSFNTYSIRQKPAALPKEIVQNQAVHHLVNKIKCTHHKVIFFYTYIPIQPHKIISTPTSKEPKSINVLYYLPF